MKSDFGKLQKNFKKIGERDSLLYRNIFKKEDVYEAGNIVL